MHLSLGLSAALAVAALTSTTVGAAPRAGNDETGSIESGGLHRTFSLHVPPAEARTGPMPILFALHGGGGTSRGMIRLAAGTFDRIADRRGMLVVYPQGFEKGWNDGRVGLDQPASLQKVDDVGFIAALIEHLARRFPVDRRRIYSCGISNGGFMSFRLACDLSDRLAAVASVVAGVSKTLSETRRPAHPVPVMMILGTDDPLVPFEGGRVGFRRKPRGYVLSAAESVRYWLRNNGCSPTPRRDSLPDRDADDETQSTRAAYSGPTPASEVVFITVHGGGHTWPGGWRYLPELVIGKTSRDFDGAEVIWEFFERHALPAPPAAPPPARAPAK